MWEMSKIVSMSNHLIRAGFSLSEWEMRVVSAAASSIQKGDKLSSSDWFVVSADTAVDLFSTDKKTIYRDLAVVAQRLFDRKISFKFSPEGQPQVERLRQARWVTDVEYRVDQGTIALKWNETVIPYLCELTEQFTQYTLSEISGLSSSHAQRLLQLLMQYRSTGYMSITIEELRFSMDLMDTYTTTKILNQKVVVPAVTAIQEHLPHFNLQWKAVKRGRKITGYGCRFVQSRATRDPLTVDFIEGASDSEQKQIASKTESPEQERKRKKQEVRDKIMDINDTNW